MKLDLSILAFILGSVVPAIHLQAAAFNGIKAVTLTKSAVEFSVPTSDFPKSFSTADGTLLKVYTIQPTSLQSNRLQAIAAVSFIEKGSDEPTFGTVWLEAILKDNNSTYAIGSAMISNIKFPDELSSGKIASLKSALENKLPQLNILLHKAELSEALRKNTEETNLAHAFDNKAPRIIYSNKPAILVLIDGNPVWQQNEAWGVAMVVNSPYTIIKNTDKRYYLFGEKQWFSAPAVTGPYSLYASYNATLKNIEKTLTDSYAVHPGLDATTNGVAIPQIIVQTEPAELIQTNGEPDFAPIQGTALLYANNSSNDIFMDINTQKYYLLLAGRWYQSDGLKQQWNYVAPPQLPTDFSKIPEGSQKDNVLANIAGTAAANEAILDAQVPQTAKVSRKKTPEEISYDGNPRFENINGTELAYAVNTATSVLKWHNRFYAVDNGIWYESRNAGGPWYVATKRPHGVELIAPDYPVYNVKYVYIYDITPDFIYTGYTPGYLNTYVLGGSIVYGTGYHYKPWRGRYYFPRPWTWGFNIWYNPWAGWSFGSNIHSGWFYHGSYNRPGSIWRGSWWGPSHYHPAYGWTAPRGHANTGYYGIAARNYNAQRNYANNGYNRSGSQYNQYNHTNIYVNRTNVVSKTNGKNNGSYTLDRNYNNRSTNNGQAVTRPDHNNNAQGYSNRVDRNNNNQDNNKRPNNVSASQGSVSRPGRVVNGKRPTGTVTRPYDPVNNTGTTTRPATRPDNKIHNNNQQVNENRTAERPINGNKPAARSNGNKPVVRPGNGNKPVEKTMNRAVHPSGTTNKPAARSTNDSRETIKRSYNPIPTQKTSTNNNTSPHRNERKVSRPHSN